MKYSDEDKKVLKDKLDKKVFWKDMQRLKLIESYIGLAMPAVWGNKQYQKEVIMKLQDHYLFSDFISEHSYPHFILIGGALFSITKY